MIPLSLFGRVYLTLLALPYAHTCTFTMHIAVPDGYRPDFVLRYSFSSSRLRFVPESAFVPGPQFGVGFC
jgi:hypothetical protein